LEAVKEAAAAWVDASLDAGTAVPSPSTLDEARRRPGYEGRTRAGIVYVDARSRRQLTRPGLCQMREQGAYNQSTLARSCHSSVMGRWEQPKSLKN